MERFEDIVFNSLIPQSLIRNSGLSGLGIDLVYRDRRVFPYTGFWQDMLSADCQPITIRFDFPQFSIIRRPRMIGKGMGRLKNEDSILALAGNRIVVFKRLECQIVFI